MPPLKSPLSTGKIVLLLLVDLKRQRLIGNPEHGGEQMIDIL